MKLQVKDLLHVYRGNTVIAVLPREEALAFAGDGPRRRVRRTYAPNRRRPDMVGIEYWPAQGESWCRRPIEYFNLRTHLAVIVSPSSLRRAPAFPIARLP